MLELGEGSGPEPASKRCRPMPLIVAALAALGIVQWDGGPSAAVENAAVRRLGLGKIHSDIQTFRHSDIETLRH